MIDDNTGKWIGYRTSYTHVSNHTLAYEHGCDDATAAMVGKRLKFPDERQSHRLGYLDGRHARMEL